MQIEDTPTRKFYKVPNEKSLCLHYKHRHAHTENHTWEEECEPYGSLTGKIFLVKECDEYERFEH